MGVHARARRAARSPGCGPRRRAPRSRTRPRCRPAGLAPTQARTLARVARVAGVERRGSRPCPGIGEWTLAQLDLFGHGRYDVPLAKDVGIRNAYARMVGVRTGSVTEDEFRAVLDRYAPWQGLAAMYMVAVGWRSGARYESGHALRRR